MSPDTRKRRNDQQKSVQGKDKRGRPYSAGGDRSFRAAISGATGERSTSGGANKPEPKNQDLKAQASPRNRIRRKPN